MRSKQYALISIMIFSVAALAACSKQESISTSAAEPVASPANANATSPPATTPANNPATPPPTLAGDYMLSEVQHKGQVTMISVGNSTEISFRPDGTYARVSRLGGKVDHTDSGEFRIEGGKQLVLRIRMWKKKFQTPAVEKKHTFSLSSDGAELRMTGADSKVGVFRRTRTLAAN
jgi:hypothetical protein